MVLFTVINCDFNLLKSAFSGEKTTSSYKWFRYLIPVVVEQLGTAQFRVVLLNKSTLVIGRRVVVLKVLTEVANVSNLWIQLPDHFFSIRSYYSVSPL